MIMVTDASAHGVLFGGVIAPVTRKISMATNWSLTHQPIAFVWTGDHSCDQEINMATNRLPFSCFALKVCQALSVQAEEQAHGASNNFSGGGGG